MMVFIKPNPYVCNFLASVKSKGPGGAFLSMFILCLSALFNSAICHEAPEINREDTLYFNEIPSVFSASKFEQKVTDAPATISVITAEEISRYGYRNLGEILASLPGMYLTDDRNYGYLGVRGFTRTGDYNSRVLILVDGQRYDDAIYLGTGIQQDFPMDIDLIERVELVRGPGSALYGSSAMLGFVNIITRRGREIAGVELNAEYGSLETYKIRGTYGARYDSGLEIMLSATKYDSEGNNHLYYPEFDAPETNNGIYANNDYENHESARAVIAYNDFRFNAAWSKRRRGVPTASYGTVFNDSRTYTDDDFLILGLSYSKLLADSIDVYGMISYVRYHYDGDYPYDWPPVYIYRDVADARSVEAELRVGFDLNERHQLLIGFEGHHAFKQEQSSFDLLDDGPYFYLDDKRDTSNWGVFIQDNLTLTSRLGVVAGLRYDRYKMFKGTFSPRIALIYKLTENSTLKALYGNAFRVPNAYELYYHDDYNTTKPADSLRPEDSDHYEIALEQQLGLHLRGTISIYKYNVAHALEAIMDPDDELFQFQNGSKLDVSGVEVSLEGKIPSGIKGRVSYSHSEGHESSTGEKLPNSPRHMAKLNLGFPILDDKLSAACELQYSSRRKLLTEGWTRSFIVANFGLNTRRFANGLSTSFHIYNLFDEIIEHAPGVEFDQRVIEQNGRSIRLKLTGSFN